MNKFDLPDNFIDIPEKLKEDEGYVEKESINIIDISSCQSF